jgi:hypothetical protein
VEEVGTVICTLMLAQREKMDENGILSYISAVSSVFGFKVSTKC